MKPAAAAFAILLFAVPAAPEALAQVNGPAVRLGVEQNRVTRVPRATDIYVRRPPVRVPKVKPVPRQDLDPLPRYGTPDKAIDRIPPT